MTLEIHVDEWVTGHVRASIAVNGRGHVRLGGYLNPNDFLDFLFLLNCGMRPRDVVRVWLPAPLKRVGVTTEDESRLLQLQARGIELAALTSDGTNVRVDEGRGVPQAGDAPLTIETERVCDRSGDLGSRHYWAATAKVGDWCLCGRRKRLTAFGAGDRVAS